MSEISFDIEDYDLLEAFQEVEGSSSSAPQGIELKELTGDEAPSDEEPSDSEPEEQSKKVKTQDASGATFVRVTWYLGTRLPRYTPSRVHPYRTLLLSRACSFCVTP